MNGQDRADANRDLRLSANEYMNALDFFPQDDELYSSASLFAFAFAFDFHPLTLLSLFPNFRQDV